MRVGNASPFKVANWMDPFEKASNTLKGPSHRIFSLPGIFETDYHKAIQVLLV
jgi:hypothetical protein